MVARGYQELRIRQAATVAPCGLGVCDWFEHGSTGMSEGLPYVHPAGVMCGDVTRCRPCKTNGPSGPLCGHCDPCRSGTANCPCPERLPHMVVDERFDPRFFVDLGFGARETVADEWVQRTGDGVEAIKFIRTRGL